jgi:phosphopantothenoylcysteine decarboxylase/phosphopantothenate--cysteine ligase
MHEPMYDHPGVLDAIERLESWGVAFVPPRIEEGKAKVASESAVLTEVARAATPDPMAGRSVVVTAGATSEAIDPVRVLTNRASGRTGREVARACYARGAEVTLVHDGREVPWATVESVESADEMLAAVTSHAADADALVSAAAVSDYTVDASPEKIRSGQERLVLELEPTPKLIDTVREQHPDLSIVGFKAETEGDDDAIAAKARETLDRVHLAFVVGNDASVMGEDRTRALIVRADDEEVVEGTKPHLGGRVAEELGRVLNPSRAVDGGGKTE